MTTKEQLAIARERAKAERARLKAGKHSFTVNGPRGIKVIVRVKGGA
jgi:hypothetical protein